MDVPGCNITTFWQPKGYFTTLVLTHGKAGFSFKHTACQSLCDLFLTVFWPLLEFLKI